MEVEEPVVHLGYNSIKAGTLPPIHSQSKRSLQRCRSVAVALRLEQWFRWSKNGLRTAARDAAFRGGIDELTNMDEALAA